MSDMFRYKCTIPREPKFQVQTQLTMLSYYLKVMRSVVDPL